MTAIALANLNENEKGVITSMHGGIGFRKRMTEIGFTRKSVIVVIRKIDNGPMVIEINGFSRIALGHGEALKIMVEVLPDKKHHD